MKATILLNYNENVNKVEEEERTRYLHSILEQLGVPIQEFWTDESTLSVDQRMKLRKILTTYEIEVIDDRDGRLKIYVSDELAAEWHKPSYKLKRDLGQRDPKKQLFLEMQVSCWSLFEESEQET